MRVFVALVLLFTACAPVTGPAPSQEPASATPAPIAPTPTANASPTPAAPPAGRLDDTVVTVTIAPFPVEATFALTKSAVAPDDAVLATLGVHRYLEGLDRYREYGDFLPVGGAFGKAVAAALIESRTPGVKRTFVLKSLRVESVYRKPWGTLALTDVRVTIADHAVDGSAPDQVEAGLLRLTGDRRLVIDSWNDATSRWFNGRIADDPAGLRTAIAQAIASYLRTESWVLGMPAETYFNGANATPFGKARAAYVASFDRGVTRARTFADVTATIERYDTFAEMASGMATVRVAGTLVTTDAAGRTQRQPVARRVSVFFGYWAPEVVEEEVTPGVWRSGGDLALVEIDVNRA